MNGLSHCLWFDGRAEEAACFYVSMLPESRIDTIVHSPVPWPGGAVGEVLVVEFTLAGQRYAALNGGPNYRLSPAFSMMVSCTDQAEIDRLWDGLLADGGTPMRCGWLTDRFGLSWQITPAGLLDMMRDPDPEKVRRVMQAFTPMVKLDIARIRAAYEGGSAD